MDNAEFERFWDQQFMTYENVLPAEVISGIQLFNKGEFFEAHEMLEIAWRAEDNEIRYLYQAILQLGVGYYHLQRNNFIGANHLLERAKLNLARFSGQNNRLDIVSIQKQIDEAISITSNSQDKINQYYTFPLEIIKIDR
jgi:hypothetical protein